MNSELVFKEKRDERIFWKSFFALLRTYPEIWDPRHERYQVREYKERAYQAMADKMREHFPNATIESAKRKLNIFKSNYKREVKRKKMTGSKSNLWYYNDLSFLPETERNFSEVSEAPIRSDSSDLDLSELTNFSVKNEMVDTILEDGIGSFNYKPEILRENHEREVGNADSILNLNGFQQNKNNDDRPLDDAEIFGRTWAAMFRRIPSSQQILAKKLVDDILFDACMGRLKEDDPQNKT